MEDAAAIDRSGIFEMVQKNLLFHIVTIETFSQIDASKESHCRRAENQLFQAKLLPVKLVLQSKKK